MSLPHPRAYTLSPIGVVRSCFREKFGIPRQPGLAPSAEAVIELTPGQRLSRAADGIEEFSHLWVIFVFHDTGSDTWRPGVRPPRLGGARKVGVLASRSPHRPNPIGLSLVEVAGVERQGLSVRIRIRGVDLLDGTPVLDLKPYLVYADSAPKRRVRQGWASQPIERDRVRWSREATHALKRVVPATLQTQLKRLATELLALDPRPAFLKRRSTGRYGMRILGYDVRWTLDQGVARVEDVVL